MTPRALLIDANLLVLWAVGAVSPRLVLRHKRLGAYVEKDYVVLSNFASQYTRVVITPNTLTEATNLALQIAEPARTQVAEQLKVIAKVTDEIYVRSEQAMHRIEFSRLGLADSAQLEVQNVDVLTDDLHYYLAAQSQGKTCFNFTHLREAAGITS